MRTVEFKLSLNQSQQVKVDSWLNTLRWVWNRGLHLLEEFNRNARWDKDSKSWVPCCSIQWEYFDTPLAKAEGILHSSSELALAGLHQLA